MNINKKRSNAYFGMHFDFHAGTFANDIGSFVTNEDIGKYLDAVKPDYIQIDTKGHPGYASYFSKIGEVAPGLTHDYLKIIREETKKRGIKLIAHHSSLWDEISCKNNPEWAIIEENGNVSNKYIDFTTDYVDKKFIPMLKELAGEYDFDGVWVDGDCWCVFENYKPEFLQKFYNESGYTSIDKENKYSASHLAYRAFCMKEFKNFVEYYISEVKKDYPNFEICSNTAFSSMHAVKPFEGIDFLSADVFNLRLRLNTRCYASHNIPWDVMSWGHPIRIKISKGEFDDSYACASIYASNNHLDRTYRMAANAISLGGGFEIIGMMNDQAEIMLYDIPLSKKVADFMNERKELNYNSKPLKNLAIWHSAENRERINMCDERVCYFWGADEGLCDLVVDAGYPVDVVFDYHVDENKINEHNVILVPESKYISQDKKDKLLEYAKNGGKLIVTGINSCLEFADTIDAKMTVCDDLGIYVEKLKSEGYIAGIEKSVIFENYNGIEFANSFAEKPVPDYKPVKTTAHTSYGKGSITFIGFDIIDEYFNRKTFVFTDIMRDVLQKIDTDANAYLKSGTNRVEIIPAEKDGKTLINLINTNEYYYFNLQTAYGEIPPVHDIEIAVKCKSEPKSIMLEPEHQKAEYTYDGNYAYVKVNKLNIHTIIAVEY